MSANNAIIPVHTCARLWRIPLFVVAWIIDFCLVAHAQNIMTFNKCSINGRSYGDAYDEDGNPVDVTEVTY
jgi:hypothetical protein